MKLSLTQQGLVRQDLNGKDFWSLPQIMNLLLEKFEVCYSQVHVRRLLKSWGMYHYKPQPQDYRRPPDAEEKLSESLKAVSDVLKLWGCSPAELAFGFADESSPEANSNKARLWSFFRKTRTVNSDKSLRHNTFGYYATQGSSMVMEIANSRAETYPDCLEAIRKANPEAKYCVVIWDNLPAHKNKEVQKAARKLGIILVQLPPYAPDLNPIEKLWKQIKRAISYQGMIEKKQELATIIKNTFNELAKSTDLAKSWIQKFFLPIFNHDQPIL